MNISPPPAHRLTPRNFVPPNAKLEPVTEADSWVTLAARTGLDPWQLILFNYPNLPIWDKELASREVNWYLKNYVGCTRSTDGRNYAFSGGLKVWVPKAPAAAPPPPPVATPTPDELAKRRVLAILAEPAVQRIHFSMGLYLWVTPGDYQAVAEGIRNGKIQVKANLALNTSALYHFGPNIIEFNPNTATDGLIVHECTHAAFDIRKLTLTVAEDEGACYVAQHIYRLLKTGSLPPPAVSWEGHPDLRSPISWTGLFLEASRLAQLAQINPFLAPQELEMLYGWIDGTNFYRNRANKTRKTDGI
jgi:hypothetical protein